MFRRLVLTKAPSLSFGRRALVVAPEVSSCLRGGGGHPNNATAAAAASFARRYLSFSFAGPRTLEEIIKKELIESKTAAEIEDIWFTYHESKVRGCDYGMCGCDNWPLDIHH